MLHGTLSNGVSSSDFFPSISVHYGTKISKSKTQMLNRSKKGNKLLTKLKMIESISKKLVEFIGHWLFVFIF